ncbi:MAG: GTPase Era [Gemmatimonadota bacterium]|nr:MAG: GTPase Era [Gemmatimonadota bacterium]
MSSTPAAPTNRDQVTRAGYVALVGRPNVGKSTLLNRMIGEKLSIVTAKAQTTWQRVTGIRTTATSQLIFLDTPGILLARDLLQRSMLYEAIESIREADVVVLLLDATHELSRNELAGLKEALSCRSGPLLAAINKVDQATPANLAALVETCRTELGVDPTGISAKSGAGVEDLAEELEAALPEGPFLYPEDDLASAPVRFFVAELVRETIFERYREEIPYSVFCRVEEYREEQDPLYIQVNLFTERNSQKRIIIGDKGGAIRALGTFAREKIEHFVGRPVYLDLWVKVLPEWRRRRRDLTRFGLRVPEEHESD